MQAAEYAHSIVYFCLQTTSTVDEVLRCRSSFRSLLSRLIVTPDVDADEMSNSRRSPPLISVSMGVDHALYMLSKALHVGRKTSHWLERSSCRFLVTLIILFVFRRADHSTSQVLTTFYVVLLLKACFKSLCSSSALPLIGPASAVTSPRTRTPRDDDWRVFRPLLKIFEYAAKQVCKQLQCNKANTRASAPPLMGFIWHASRTNNWSVACINWVSRKKWIWENRHWSCGHANG